ncbi:MAG: trigger factor [Calditrichaeota bacterium]|nr:MAG: trigger factor [Calditrichota bacterium]
MLNVGVVLQVHVTEKENCVRDVEIIVPQEELAPEFEKSLRNAQKKVKLEGFRKGKVPLSIVKKLYGPGLEAEVIENLLPVLFQRGAAQEDLHIAAPASIKNMDYKPGGDLTVSYEVEVEPEFELQKYENFKFDRQMYEVSDDDLTEALEQIRRDNSTWEKVEGKAEEDHFVSADLQELDESGLPIIGNKMENRFLKLKDDNAELSDIGKQLVGIGVDETRTITVSVPSDGQTGEAKNVKFEVTVKDIQTQSLPELDDELAKDAGDYETLDALKSELEKRIQKNTQRELDKGFYHSIIEKLISENKFDLPDGMIQFYLDAIIKDMRARLREGEEQQFDEKVIREQYREGAIFNLKWRLIRKKIAAAHDITIEENDVEAFINDYASDRGVDGKLLLKQMRKNPQQMEDIEADVFEQKVLGFLSEKQKVKDNKVNRNDLEKQK